MSKYFKDLRDDIVYRITKSSNPNFINKDFQITYDIDHENYHLEFEPNEHTIWYLKSDGNGGFYKTFHECSASTKIVFDDPTLWISIVIFEGGKLIKNYPEIRENFRCSFSSGNFEKFLKDNEIEYRISKEHGKKLIKQYKGLIEFTKSEYDLKNEDLN